MSPTNIIAGIRIVFAIALLAYLMIKLFVDWDTAHGVAAMGVWAVGNELLGGLSARFTADTKDVAEIDRRVDQVIDHVNSPDI